MPQTFNNVTRSQIMRRAWQLARLNKGTATASPRDQLSQWMVAAWKESREGRTQNWTFLSTEHAARNVAAQLHAAEMGNGSDRFTRNDGLIASLRASLDRLNAVSSSPR